MLQFVDLLRGAVRKLMARLARELNRLTRGALHPDWITIAGLVMHVPIAVLIALGGYTIVAAVMLVIFGLFDTIDGELARLQGRASVKGMLLDASTDRMKETLLYVGAAYALAVGSHPTAAAWAVAACGASLCVSYVKAKGEAAVAAVGTIDHAKLNRLFKDGLLTFELRMVVLLVGLLFNQLMIAVAVIAVLAAFTAFQRLIRISKAL
ncbi:MAG TPA: CDP-alcohol phosphatidyltransferase family protein [Candidatus Saccharimonadales bacterium]|nr:CDP-alcohol phosphatidyltransferase family protein [Candidatus Saccharimonadales bacterium]